MTSCDDNLIKYIPVQWVTIAAKTKQDVNFYLMHSRVSEENIQILKDFAEKIPNFNFIEIKITDTVAIEKLQFLSKHGGNWSYEAYMPLLCAEYLNCERVLCIDAGDILFNGDVTPYYTADFGDNALIITPYQYHIENGEIRKFTKNDTADLQKNHNISFGVFNSGSYVINVDYFRKKITLDKLCDFVKSEVKKYPNLSPQNPQIYFGDQGLFSLYFIENMQYFDYEKIRSELYMPYNFCMMYFKKLDKLGYLPVIFHYCGMKGKKPWDFFIDENMLSKYNDTDKICNPFNLHYYKLYFISIFWEYAAGTPFYNEIKLQGLRNTKKIFEEKL
ncbi:hypothetical protein FACS1894132_03000 [Clostridia bacterium]|nr:hypothetical protein FACS1894132_03000 [Clostridia bacterium]